ncbi:MAG TPA: DNA polymerase II large subunit [Candidatus Thermoplasmatota archaeon]|nr:DNA polymerase II large subunit [Candidatus Thermoplasmatota archaeon]
MASPEGVAAVTAAASASAVPAPDAVSVLRPDPVAAAPAAQAVAPPKEAERPVADGGSARPPRAERATVAPPASSPAQQAYFDALHAEAMRCYAIAKQARRKGKDPSMEVEIPAAEDLAARVEAQVGPVGIAQKIRDATARLGNREVVCLQVAKDVAEEMQRQGAPKERIVDQAVRTGLSILTEGVLVAPLEGIAEVKVGRNGDGSDYLDMFFAGPIRAAGGTAQAMSLLIGDLVRRQLGIGRYIPTDAEVERYKEEVPAYKQVANLQYTPTGPEIELIVKNCPVCINGEGTEREEVTGNRDLPRVDTNRIRSGACLVLAEGLVLKAPKVLKHVDALKLEGWDFLKEFQKKGAKADDKKDAGAIPDIKPSDKYAADVIAGRPMFAHPSRPGGFRLRYGRSRTGGLASNSIHPATMALVDEFLAVGTQMKVERPGKGTLATPCDELEGPTVVLHNGTLARLDTLARARELRPAVKEIVDLGEILIPFGEFAENNQLLPHSSWCWEWWVQEHATATGQDPLACKDHPQGTLDPEEAVRLAEQTKVPLHPDFTLLWHDVQLTDVRALGEWVKARGVWEDGTLWVHDASPECRELLVRLLCLHELRGGNATGVGATAVRIDPRLAYPFLRCLGLERGAELPQVEEAGGASAATVAHAIVDTERRRILYDPCQPDPTSRYPVVEVVARLAGFGLRPKAPCRIGARMGRPEKADARKMKPPPHGLFPIAKAGESQRLLRKAMEAGQVEVEVGERQCTRCGRKGWRTFCDCGGHTDVLERKGAAAAAAEKGERPKATVDVRAEAERARAALRLDRIAETVKCVEHLVSKAKVPEPLEKGLLRARHDVYTFKDGTVRFDMTDVPATHFRPREVGLSVAKAIELGYTHDCQGEPLARDDQVLELRVQDLIVSDSCGDYLLKATQYLDELLERFYGLPPYYRCQKRKDLIGHLTIGLAPHTSGGVLSRIVGFTKAQVHFAHPYFHAAKRRNCLAPDTMVYTSFRGRISRVPIATLYAAADDVRDMDDMGTTSRTLPGLHVLSVDPATGQCLPARVARILRIRAPEHLLRIRTASGRSLTCSPQHRLLLFDGRQLQRAVAASARTGQSMAFAGPGPELNVVQVEGGLLELQTFGDLTCDPITQVEHVPARSPWLFDLEVEGTHAFLCNEGIATSNCDGDEDAVLLLLDGLLNFSRAYIPESRGGMMDLPLVLTTRLDPNEVDKEAHNVDTLWRYPLEFYQATTRHAHPNEVAKKMGLVASRVGKPEQYEGLGYTHDTKDINEGPAASAYKTLGTMKEKMTAQMELARKIRAVDEADLGAKVIGTHLLPDLMGNLKAFSKQAVRCSKCNRKYRRMPLKGACLACGNPGLTLTVHEGSVRKYLNVSKEIAEKYNLDPYTRQRIALLEASVESVFNNDKVRKAKLSDFFGK